MKKIRRKTNKSVLAICFTLVALTTFILLQFTRMEKLENIFELQVDLDSELAYTLSVSYDGVDRNSDKSSELLNADGKPKIIKIESGYIYVEDVLPDGLEFQKFNFVGDDDQVLFATKRDSSTSGKCNGYVVNDSDGSTDPKNNHGLHYDENTRKITFKIKNLTAGCKIDVGIITKTPATIEGNRKDFYNTATAWEGTQMAKSNMTHAWIQTKQTSINKVRYRLVNNPIDGTVVPPNVSVPDTQEYAPDSIVNVAFEPKVEGYTFSGWKIIDPLNLQIVNGKFTMPSFENDSDEVVLEGYFTELPKYEVTYRIEGDEKPSGYVLPLKGSYYANEMVKVDSMSAGDVFKGYTFLGWETVDVNISSDKDFIMPSKNVEIVGRWERIKYKVTYAFHEGVRPPNYQTILNELNSKDNTYAPGEKVKLPIVDDIPATNDSNGYRFQGWYKEDNFVMPEEDVIVYGEWKIVRKTFTPSISKEIVDKKDYYKKGDIVEYNITITNYENYEINNVIVKEHNVNAKFVENNNDIYNVRSTHVVEIPSIPAKGSVIVKATYEVTENDTGTIINTVEILGATANNNDLDTSDEAKEKYKASASFDIWPELKISKNVSNEEKVDKVFQFHITSEKGYDSWITLTNKESEVVYLEPNDTYSVKEVVPQEYILEKVDGAFTYNGGSIEVELGDKFEVNFTNKHQNKGYYHSEGRVANEVRDCDTGECKTLWRTVRNNSASKTTTMDGTANSSKIYYYDSNDNNNVLFADKCWRIVRTTDTNGVKLMYNGEAVNDYKRERIAENGYTLLNTNISNEYVYDSSTSQWKSVDDNNYKSSTIEFTISEPGDYVLTYNMHLSFSNETVKFYRDDKLLESLRFDKTGRIVLGEIDSSTIIKINYYKFYSDSNVNFALEKKIDSNEMTQECLYSNSSISYDSYSPGLNPELADFYDGYMYNANMISKYNFSSKSSSSKSYTIYDYQFLYNDDNYMYGKEISYDNETGMYTIEDATQHVWSSDWSNLIYNYTCKTNSNTCEEIFYVISASTKNYSYYMSLTNGEDANSKKMILAKEYEIINNKFILKDPEEVYYKDWYDKYNNYKNYYACPDFTSLSCDSIYYLSNNYSTSFYYYIKDYIAFGSSVKWDGEKYVLQDVVKIADINSNSNLINNHRYTCLSSDGFCRNVKYIYDSYISSNFYSMDYVEVSDGELVSDIPNNILGINAESSEKYKDGQLNPAYINVNNSKVKDTIDKWYMENLTSYTDYIEDTIYCNDRSIYDYGRWNPSSGNTDSLIYGSLGNNNLICPRKLDSFTVSDKNGNGDLTYPVGLLTLQEEKLIKYKSSETIDRCEVSVYINMTPINYRLNESNANNIKSLIEFENSGIQPYSDCEDSYYYSARPVISLKADTMVCIGDGTKTNPYRIEPREGSVE